MGLKLNAMINKVLQKHLIDFKINKAVSLIVSNTQVRILLYYFTE